MSRREVEVLRPNSCDRFGSQVSFGVVEFEQRERSRSEIAVAAGAVAVERVAGAGVRAARRARRVRAQSVRQRAVPARLPRAARPLQGVLRCPPLVQLRYHHHCLASTSNTALSCTALRSLVFRTVTHTIPLTAYWSHCWCFCSSPLSSNSSTRSHYSLLLWPTTLPSAEYLWTLLRIIAHRSAITNCSHQYTNKSISPFFGSRRVSIFALIYICIYSYVNRPMSSSCMMISIVCA